MTDEFVMDRRTFVDEQTGREVWQVTSGDFECVTPYMDRGTWTSDDKYLIFMCNRDGSWQPYRLELETGQATPLCRLAKNATHAFFDQALDPAHDEAHYSDGKQYYAVNVRTLRKRLTADFANVADFTEGYRQPVLSGDGSLLMAPVRPDNKAALLFVAATDGSGIVQRFEMPPDKAWIRPCHEQFCPTDNNLVSICGLPDYQDDATAPPEKRVREWLWNRRTGDVKPLVLMPPGFRATHCIWGRSGRRFYFHRKTCPWYVWVPTALCSVNRDGGDLRVYFETSEHKLGHSCPSPDEKWIVSDSQDPDRNLLLLAHTERDEQHVICWPNMSVEAKTSKRPDKRRPDLPPHTHRHVHPRFSETGRYVNYVSDVTGTSHVYVVRVDDLTARG
jgi:hypothetical protein